MLGIEGASIHEAMYDPHTPLCRLRLTFHAQLQFHHGLQPAHRSRSLPQHRFLWR